MVIPNRLIQQPENSVCLFIWTCIPTRKINMAIIEKPDLSSFWAEMLEVPKCAFGFVNARLRRKLSKTVMADSQVILSLEFICHLLELQWDLLFTWKWPHIGSFLHASLASLVELCCSEEFALFIRTAFINLNAHSVIKYQMDFPVDISYVSQPVPFCSHN